MFRVQLSRHGSKKDQKLRAKGHPQRALAATLLPVQGDDELELDELWSFVGCKANRVWIWVALCRRTRQVVAWMWGDRSKYTCESLWAKVSAMYKNCPCYADGCEAYDCVVPAEQLHQQEKKGPTNHLERFNLTLRQRLARFTRKTLAFSKSLFMHIVSLRLFFLRYNTEQAAKYNLSLPT